jgi:hypothetical protein
MKLYDQNALKFYPLKWVECINYDNQHDDEYDFIRVGEKYPVVLEMSRNGCPVYLIINRKGYKHYWDAKDFKTVSE